MYVCYYVQYKFSTKCLVYSCMSYILLYILYVLYVCISLSVLVSLSTYNTTASATDSHSLLLSIVV